MSAVFCPAPAVMREHDEFNAREPRKNGLRILMVHNEYGKPSGEETVVNGTRRLLEKHGHEVISFTRSSTEIESMRWGKTRSFFSGIYSRASRLMMRGLLAKHCPDIVHIHNLSPLISPSILPECRRAGVPVVMTLHNYRLTCPNGLQMVNRHICEKCSGGREYWCVIHNCENSYPKSIGYALRTYVARKRRYYLDNITVFAPLTEFHRNRLICEGVPPARIAVLPNMVSFQDGAKSYSMGRYVAFVGRVSPEKGIDTLLATAQKCPDIPFRIAGSYERMPFVLGEAPGNCRFVGHLTGAELEEFYEYSRLLVMPSVWFETFGLSVAEAMASEKPVVTSRIGALAEMVEDGETGLLFEPGNAVELARKIRYLWDRPELCRKLGQAGRAKALREYSPERYYERLMGVYHRAIESGAGTRCSPTAAASKRNN